MTRAGAAFVLAVLSSAVQAQEPRGCDKFAWPVERLRSQLTGISLPSVATASEREVSPRAFTLTLAPMAAAKLLRPPERPPRQQDTFAGYVSFSAPTRGEYQVTLSGAAWVDLIQGDKYLKPTRFSGALDCEGIRKMVRFDLDAAPFALQVSGVPNGSINAIVERVPAD